MGSLQNPSPALRRSQSHLRRSALCVLVLAVSFLAVVYLKTPFQTTGVKNSDDYSSPSPVFPPRRKLTWVADKLDPLRKLCISTDIHKSIREYIEGRYLTQLSMNGTINPKPFMLNCYYAEDVNAIKGIRFLISGSSTTGLVCSSAVESVEIRAHSSWMCSIDMAHMHYFIPSSNKRRRTRPDGKSWQQRLLNLFLMNNLFRLPPPPPTPPTSPENIITLSSPPGSAASTSQVSGFFGGIVYNCYVFKV